MVVRWAWSRILWGDSAALRKLGVGVLAVGVARRLVQSKPETVFRGSIDPGAGIQIRVLEPGER